ncbi:hypothetical protein Dimus_000757 [Dionaea muscipula]
MSWKKEVAKSGVHGVDIEFDGMTLATILNILGNNGICDYIKELGIGANRRRDEDENAPAENVENEEVNQEENQDINIEWETESEEEAIQETVHVEPKAQAEGGPTEKEVVNEDSGSREKFYDAVGSTDEDGASPDVVVPALAVQVSVQKKDETRTTGVDPSGPLSSLPDFELIHLQAEFARALQANTRFQELYQQLKSNPTTSTKP